MGVLSGESEFSMVEKNVLIILVPKDKKVQCLSDQRSISTLLNVSKLEQKLMQRLADKGKCTGLILLDYSKASGTIDHTVLQHF